VVSSLGPGAETARSAGETAIYACICFGINERTVREHVRAGAATLAALAEACGAGSDCAGCRDRLRRLISEETLDPRTTTPAEPGGPRRHDR